MGGPGETLRSLLRGLAQRDVNGLMSAEVET